MNAGNSAIRGAYNRPIVRLAVIDNDSGFVTVLAKRADAAGWQLRVALQRDPTRRSWWR